MTVAELEKLLKRRLPEIDPDEDETETSVRSAEHSPRGPVTAGPVDPNDTSLQSVGKWPDFSHLTVKPARNVAPLMTDEELEAMIEEGEAGDHGLRLYRKTGRDKQGRKRREWTVLAKGPSDQGYQHGWDRTWYENGQLKSQEYFVVDRVKRGGKM
jgi:hypothetical protein